MVNWICATVVRPETVAALSDNAKRDAAYRESSWQIRWPALAFACCGLIAAAWLTPRWAKSRRNKLIWRAYVQPLAPAPFPQRNNRHLSTRGLSFAIHYCYVTGS
jgi:hypothetical protein